MTIRMLQSWNGYAAQTLVKSLTAAEETRLIGLNLASADLDGAFDPKSLNYMDFGGNKKYLGNQRIESMPLALPFDFSVAAAWTPSSCTAVLDTTKTKTNTAGSLKITPSTASGIVNHAGYPRGIILDSNLNIGLWVYFDSGSEANGPANAFLTLTLSPDFNYTNSIVMSYAGNHIRWNQWNYLCMRVDEAGSWNAQGTGATGVTYTGAGKPGIELLYVQVQLGNMSGFSAYVNQLQYGLRARPSIVFGFDGISAALLNNILPLMKQYDIPWFACFNGNAGGLTTSPAFARVCKANGAEIINHGWQHAALSGFTVDSTIRAEIVNNWNMMQAENLISPDQEKIFKYPQNTTHPQAKRILAEEGYVYARGYKNFNMAETPEGFDGLMEIGSFAFENITLRRALAMCDAAWIYGCSTHLFAHDVDMTYGQTGAGSPAGTIYIDDMVAVLKRLAYLRDKGYVDLYTPSGWYKNVVKQYP